MKSKFIKESILYDGSQLRSLFNYIDYDLQGDSILSFCGPCEVSQESMVDGEDQKSGDQIRSHNMLHFLVEIFHRDLFSAVCLQRLMADLMISNLKCFTQKDESFFRKGDDIYQDDRKLSISIATSSPVSQLIHFAVNITNEGTPVKTLSLEDLGISSEELAQNFMKSFVSEYQDILMATTKVHWVR